MGQRSSGFRHRQVGSVRRTTAWDVGPGNTTPTAVAADGKYLSAGVSPTRDGLTLVRTRGAFMMYLNATTALNDGMQCALGIAKVTIDAFNIGITAIPGPITDEAWDGWLYHRYFSLYAPAAITGAGIVDRDMALPLTSAVRFEIDSKAMRKIANEEIFIVIMEQFKTGTAVAQFRFVSRMLFKLP